MSLAPTTTLFTIPTFLGSNEDYVVANVTKKELKDLYSAQMVPSSKPSRKYYDKIKLSAPLGICPFCGFGHVYTLDHYLPKAKYPLISILPVNLVPSCSDCNKGKSASTASNAGELCMHPYFDHGHFINEQWLYAQVIETTPITITFFVAPPSTWSLTDQQRVSAHFSDFDLAKRYSVQAASELSTLKYELQYDFDFSGGSTGIRHELDKRIFAAEQQHKNSWKTAMYQALKLSGRYCNGGFRLE
ncbi:HNH endonuclease [Vibrio sp. 10N.286.46.A8]|uniref:HNH endonuclease n=1 Tax=unclassified Vibrio TaxID=2614977 RepID=UPI00352F9ADE